MDFSTHYFRIADFNICIRFNSSSKANSMKLLPSFEPFRVEESQIEGQSLLFTLTVDDTMPPHPKAERDRIRDFDTGNGHTVVDLLPNGGYQYIMRNIDGADCCLLISNKDFTQCRCALNGNFAMRSFGLNNAVMLAYAYASSHHATLLIHASLVRHQGWGYPFIAKSGTGKSTQVSMWLRYIPDCDLMNDDNPIVRVIDGKAYIYGGPWSGKTPCYRNVKAPLGAITRIDRAPENSIEKLPTVEAFASFLPACSCMKWDEDIFGRVCDTVGHVLETTPVFTLHCLPNREAAEVCHAAIARKQTNDAS